MWAKILNCFKNVIALSSEMQTTEAIRGKDHWSSGAIVWVTDFSYLGSSCVLNTFFFSVDRCSLVPLEAGEFALGFSSKENNFQTK